MILIVDDEPLNRFALGRILKREGYEVAEAADGSEALELVSKRRFDLVITDLRMPNLDGADLAVQIHANWPQTTVILISGYFSHKAQKVISSGLADFIYKPIERDVLIAKVQSAVSRFSIRKVHPASAAPGPDKFVSALSASQRETCPGKFKPLKT